MSRDLIRNMSIDSARSHTCQVAELPRGGGGVSPFHFSRGGGGGVGVVYSKFATHFNHLGRFITTHIDKAFVYL